MTNTFEKEVSFAVMVVNVDNEGKAILKDGSPEYVQKIVTKTATFKELVRTDATQRELCWNILKIVDFKQGETPTINDEAACNITNAYINELVVVNDNFTQQDKTDLLNDNIGVVNFGLWLVHNKIIPFFLQLNMI